MAKSKGNCCKGYRGYFNILCACMHVQLIYYLAGSASSFRAVLRMYEAPCRWPQKIEYNSSGNLHFVRFQDGAVGSKKRLLIIIIFNRTLYLRSLICLVLNFIRSLHSRQRHLEIARNEGFHYCYILFSVVITSFFLFCYFNLKNSWVPYVTTLERRYLKHKLNNTLKEYSNFDHWKENQP